MREENVRLTSSHCGPVSHDGPVLDEDREADDGLKNRLPRLLIYLNTKN